ncbi:MAG: DUF502 domain-containing protein [Planctomycetota bacterium]
MAKAKPPAEAAPPAGPAAKRPLDPFRRAVLRGLGVLLPPLLTIVIFLWVGNTVVTYMLEPVEQATESFLVWSGSDIRTAETLPEGALRDGLYVEAEGGKNAKYVPADVYADVKQRLGSAPMPDTARGVYQTHVRQKWLQRRFVIPIFLGVLLLALYLLGKFLAAGIGRFFWNRFELVIDRVPLVRNVYSSVKQVTDFLFSDPDVGENFTRVVAVEYPRKGIWTVAFVTGESMLDIESAANEPVMSVLIPTSPMPFTGFTITVKKSESVDLNLTIDQAFQFIVSCGVVVPPQQLTEAVAARNAAPQVPHRDTAGESLALAARAASDE